MIPARLLGVNAIENFVQAGDTWRGFSLLGYAGENDTLDDLPPRPVSAKLQFRDMDRRFIYELNTDTNSVDGLPEGYPDNETGVIYLPITEPVAATALVDRRVYEITSVGTTDFTLVGAADNNIGTQFVATGPGTGTGMTDDTMHWDITVESQPLPMAPGKYKWELEVLDIMNVTRSILTGHIVLCKDGVRPTT